MNALVNNGERISEKLILGESCQPSIHEGLWHWTWAHLAISAECPVLLVQPEGGFSTGSQGMLLFWPLLCAV